MMSYGGNNRAQIFFKQHGWTDGGKIDAKYTSRAAQLYKQLLVKEVAKGSASSSLPSSPTGSPSFTPHESTKESSSLKDDTNVSTPKVRTTSVKKPLGAKKTGKSGGLGAKKLSSKVDSIISLRYGNFDPFTLYRVDFGCLYLEQGNVRKLGKSQQVKWAKWGENFRSKLNFI